MSVMSARMNKWNNRHGRTRLPPGNKMVVKVAVATMVTLTVEAKEKAAAKAAATAAAAAAPAAGAVSMAVSEVVVATVATAVHKKGDVEHGCGLAYWPISKQSIPRALHFPQG